MTPSGASQTYSVLLNVGTSGPGELKYNVAAAIVDNKKGWDRRNGVRTDRAMRTQEAHIRESILTASRESNLEIESIDLRR